MRTLAAVALLAALWFAPPDRAAPVTAQEKGAAPKWEYGTLSTPGQFKGQVPPGRYTWTTGAGDVAADDWKDLAAKLKVAVKDPDVPTRVVRALVLDHLGADRWELVAQSEPPAQN